MNSSNSAVHIVHASGNNSTESASSVRSVPSANCSFAVTIEAFGKLEMGTKWVSKMGRNNCN